MAHKAQMEFIKSVRKRFKPFFKKSRVLEIGSYNVNGSVRKFFKNCAYTGIDVAPGNDVDVVASGDTYDAPDHSFDVCISCECFEHNPQWVETFRNMLRMTRPGGLIIMTCATTGRAEHGTSEVESVSSLTSQIEEWKSYYRNLEENDFRKEFSFDTLFSTHEFAANLEAKDLYFYGIVK